MNLTQTNEKEYEMLKRAYLQATKEGKEQFEIQGQPIRILTKFAKYWLEAIENQRKTTGQRIYEPEKHDQTCPNKNCGYKWTSRIAGKPKACPNCKTRIQQ